MSKMSKMSKTIRKVSELPYERYTVEQGRSAFAAYRAAWTAASTVEQALAAREILLTASTEYATAAALANCRYTLDTRDPFYAGEVDYYDSVSPLLGELFLEADRDLLTTPLRPGLEKVMNPRIFRKAELSLKSFSPAVTADCQTENAVVTEYSGLMSGMTFDYEGKKIPLSLLRGHLDDPDRATRAAAADAIGKGLRVHAEQLDDLYDRLVKIRTGIARKLGYATFTPLGYARMERMDYDAGMVKTFRENVRRDLVPVVAQLKKTLAGELGIDRIAYYDDSVYSPGASPRPILPKEGIFRESLAMYREMDAEIGDFMEEMQAADAFDVDAREGKWGGGYCTNFPKYEQPFILANFNGTAGDIEVITHEFGHALAAKNVYRYGDRELEVGGMETAECHSMSMEFLCWPYAETFFGAQANAFRRRHLLSALSFIPYGVIVDEFQETVYENPGLTPAQRKAVYLDLEKKYRPYLHFEGIPYLEEGTRWQYQMHIYESPFYYIDYCLAQTAALGFLLRSREDYKGALRSYVALSRAGGTKAFPELLREAGIVSPFEDGALASLAKKSLALAETLK